MYEIGTDISWWQGVVNWVKMKLKAAFVIIRAGSVNSVTGKMYEDYNIAWNGSQAEEHGMRKGFYWFYREFGKAHAIEQARYFWNIVKGWSIEEGLFIDVETWDATRESVIAFLVELQRISGLDDSLIGVYSRASLWNNVIKPTLWFGKFKCWVARYHGGVDHPWKDDPRLRMQPWSEYDYWQFSADGNGKGFEYGVDSEDIDLNRKPIKDLPPVVEPEELEEVKVIYSPSAVRISLAPTAE